MLRKVLIVLSLMLISGVLFYDSAHTHSGRTDANGGHYNRKTGTYHYHNSGRSRTRPSYTPLPDTTTKTTPSLISYPSEIFLGDTASPVTRIIDGDTIEIRYNGKSRKVALIGVNTPETVHPEKPIEAFGKEATAFIKNLLKGESVYLRFDSNRTDKYGRLLAYLYRAPDGLFVNLEIIRQGYGKVYTTFPFKHKALFQHYSGQAQQAGRGLWSASSLGSRQAQIEEVPRTQTVYITRTGAKYHLSSCRYLKYSKIPISLKKAKQNYGPCSVCRP